jgi:hypothetical protein
MADRYQSFGGRYYLHLHGCSIGVQLDFEKDLNAYKRQICQVRKTAMTHVFRKCSYLISFAVIVNVKVSRNLSSEKFCVVFLPLFFYNRLIYFSCYITVHLLCNSPVVYC